MVSIFHICSAGSRIKCESFVEPEFFQHFLGLCVDREVDVALRIDVVDGLAAEEDRGPVLPAVHGQKQVQLAVGPGFDLRAALGDPLQQPLALLLAEDDQLLFFRGQTAVRLGGRSL